MLKKLNKIQQEKYQTIKLGNWTNYIQEQKKVCDKHKLPHIPVHQEHKIGIADNVLSNILPLNGLRHPLADGTTGWFIWAGEDFSEDPNFFKAHCVKHLDQMKPEIIKYLGMPPGYRFLLGENGYEDIWYDSKLLDP